MDLHRFRCSSASACIVDITIGAVTRPLRLPHGDAHYIGRPWRRRSAEAADARRAGWAYRERRSRAVHLELLSAFLFGPSTRSDCAHLSPLMTVLRRAACSEM